MSEITNVSDKANSCTLQYELKKKLCFFAGFVQHYNYGNIILKMYMYI